jgi:hypothetical protein
MTYQTDEKYFTKMLEYFVGAVKLALYSLTTLGLLFCVFTKNLL